jgi:hypothetical protein
MAQFHSQSLSIMPNSILDNINHKRHLSHDAVAAADVPWTFDDDRLRLPKFPSR